MRKPKSKLPPIPSEEEVRKELAKRSILRFTEYTMPKFKASWHHKKLCEKLDDFISGKIPRLMVFMPPRHGKSELGSRRLPAYILGRNPDAKVIACSYADGLASTMNRDVQRIIDTESYRELFPKTTLNSKNVRTDAKGSYIRNSETFEIVGFEGSYRSAGVGGGITGKGADFAIIDDPIKNMEEAKSPTVRNKVWEWYTSTLYTRLEGDIVEEGEESENEANILVILTRWHEDDLAGRLLEQAKNDPEADQWDVIEFPAIREDFDNEEDPRDLGEALWPQKYPLRRLNKIKASAGPQVWTALYQQKPAPSEGAIIKKEWMQKRYKPSQLPKGGTISLSVDATFKGNKTSDFVVIQAWKECGVDFYGLGQIRERMGFTDTIKAIAKMVKKYEPNEIIIEDKANGSAIIEVLQKKFFGVVAVSPKESKEARLQSVAPMWEAGNVHLPDGEPWVDDLESEVLFFPNGKHDDQVDAMTQYLNKRRQDSSYSLEAILTM